MIRSVRLRNFKAWEDTGVVEFAPITGFFGANSAGKSSLMQFILMMKQTAEASDRALILNFGDDRSLVELGTFADAVYQHNQDLTIGLSLEWELPKPLRASVSHNGSDEVLETPTLGFELKVGANGNGRALVESFAYTIAHLHIGMVRKRRGNYELEVSPADVDLRRRPGRPAIISETIKCYGFPDMLRAAYDKSEVLADLPLEFERLFTRVYYLGPLRDQPKRRYAWAGAEPSSMGARGEEAVAALLAGRLRGKHLSLGKGKRRRSLEEIVAYWLEQLGMVEEFGVEEIAPGTNTYRVWLRTDRSARKVLLTDVGFGVSQVLPVLTLAYYAPAGSIIILEHPEIHLHPAVQSALADVLISAVQSRQLQIIVESHSEHFLRRLQRRIAEEHIRNDDVALYFCDRSGGRSRLSRLDVDLFGEISNWPEAFFGDEFDEMAQTDLAAARRRAAAEQ